MNPADVAYVEKAGVPLVGMRAVGDNGYLYEWTKGDDQADGRLGGKVGDFFRKIGRGIKKGVKAVGKGIKKGLSYIRKGIRWAVSKTAFGRFVLRIKDKIVDIALKIVKPLAKFVGKWAPRVAPVAALIPGVGPAIAGGLVAAGTIARAYNKYGAVVENITVESPEKGKYMPFEKIQFPNESAKQGFIRDMTTEAKKLEAKGKKEIDRLNKMLAARPLPGSLSPFQKVGLKIQQYKAKQAASAAAAIAAKAAAAAKESRAKAAAAASLRARQMAAAKKASELRARGAAASRAAAAMAKHQGDRAKVAASAAAYAAQQQKLASTAKQAIRTYKQKEAKRPRPVRLRDRVKELRAMGYKVRVKRAA
jgi:hypothetical protein